MKILGPRLTVAALTLVIYGYFCGGYVNNVCANAVADVAIAIVDDRSFHIDAYAGNSNDISEHDGHIFSGFGPGLSFILVPVYVAIKPVLALIPEELLRRADKTLSDRVSVMGGGHRPTKARARVLLLIIAGTVFVSIPLGMLTTLNVVRISRSLFPSLTDGDASLLALATAFGTLILVYSVNLMHTGVAAFLVWLAVTSSMRTPANASARALLLSGFMLGLAPAVDYPAASYVVCAGLFILFISRREARLKVGALLATGAAPPVLALMGYHASAFGSAFTNAYRFRIRTGDRGVFDVTNLDSSLPNAPKVYVAFLNSNSGLLLYFPLLVLGIGAAACFLYTERAKRTKLFWGLNLGIVSINLAIYCSFPLFLGPGSAPGFGVRYMTYSAPFVMVTFAALLSRLQNHHVARKALLGLAAFNALPILAYACYGSPAFPWRGYWTLLMQVGPGTYTWTKLYEAKLLTTPVFAWLGAGLMTALLILWARSVRSLLSSRALAAPGTLTSVRVETAPN